MSRLAPHFEMYSVQEDYNWIVHCVMNYGDIATSRGMQHRELIGAQIRLEHPQFSLATGIGRRLNTRIAYVEALQLISGENYGNLLDKVSNGSFRQYFNGEVMHGSYGPRLRPQLINAVSRLGEVDNRQVVMTIWDPFLDAKGDRRDIPCTVAMQFLLRNNKLHMVVTMRSNDVWRGFPYDVFQFTQLQCTIANAINCEVGEYVHNVGSLHLYESDVEEVRHLTDREPTAADVFNGMERTEMWNGSGPVARFEAAQRSAREILSHAVGDDKTWMYPVAPGFHQKAREALCGS